MSNVMKFEGKIIRWVDGDTVDVMVDLGFRMFSQQRFRLRGVNAPETGKPGSDEALAVVNRMCPAGSSLSVTCRGHDPYGRWIADIPATFKSESDVKFDLTVNEVLLKKGLALPYP